MLKRYFPTYSFFISLLLLTSYVHGASSYQVKNYRGHIGKYPIHISLQHYKSFGSGLEFKGSYYYDKQLKPIPLYGKYNKDGNVELCETHDAADFSSVFVQGTKEQINTDSCQFLLTFSASGAVGEWRNSNKKLTVNLQMTGNLDNKNNGHLHGIMEIPFWGQTQKHSFIGVYESSTSGIKINRIKVMDKQSKKVFQEFNPQENCDFGFLMTPIYMNIDGFYSMNGEQVILNCASSQGGDFVIYSFDNKQKKFTSQK
jgi:hypothetical protein